MENISTEKWQKAQKWEENWHGSCVNSLNEEQKQLIYAEKMGLVRTPTPKTPFNFDMKGKTIFDIGSGPYSLLLKCVNFEQAVVADPLMNKFPKWVKERYLCHGLQVFKVKGENIDKMFKGNSYDEVWIYNVLEHVENPKKIIKNALKLGRVVRIFEWLGTRTNVGHPHTLNEKDLDKWLGGQGKAEVLKRDGAVGRAYYGVFKGDKYEEKI